MFRTDRLFFVTVFALSLIVAPYLRADEGEFIQLSKSPDQANYGIGQTVTLNATLSDQAQGKEVQFLRGGQAYATDTTNANGVASTTFQPTEVGTVSFKATADGYDDSNTVEVTTSCCIPWITQEVGTNSLAVTVAGLNQGDCPAGACGVTVIPAAGATEIDISAHQVGCEWRFSFSFSHGIRTGVCYVESNITDICDAQSELINQDNFCALANGFWNGGSGNGGGDCFVVGETIFGCSDITTTHEDTHVADFRALVAARLANLGHFPLAITCPDLDTPGEAEAAQSTAITAAANGAYNNALADLLMLGEAAAWASEFPAARLLAEAICARAAQEEWGECATCDELLD